MAIARIEGVGMTRFGRRSEGLLELCCEAVNDLSKSVTVDEVDALFFGCMNPEEFTSNSNLAVALSDATGLTSVPALRVETTSSSGAAVFQQAAKAIMSGECEKVICIAGEKMTHLETRRTTAILAEVIAPIERRYGTTMPALAALITRRYMHDFGMTREALAKVPIKNHANGAKNPHAHFQKPADLEKILGSKVVSDPLTVFDCAPISDGACAAILSSNRGNVAIKGMGQATDTLALADRKSLTSFNATKLAARRAYERAGTGPSEIDVVEIHDAFSTFEIIGSEDLGFFEPGQGWKAADSGETELNGEMPINTSGGLKARGHPVGASGLAQIVEIYLQLTGGAGDRQIDARKGLSHSMGGLANNNFVTILEAIS